MATNIFAHNPLKIFSDENIEIIHGHVLRLLKSTGVRIDSEEAHNLLEDYGVRCNRENRRVYPNEDNIKKALASVSREYDVYKRNTEKNECIRANKNNTYVICGGSGVRMYDNGKYTKVTLDDFIDSIVLDENLDNIDILINPIEPEEFRGENLFLKMAAYLFSYSTKPLLLQVSGRRDLAGIIRMARLIAGGESELKKHPLFMTGTNAEPPLHITKEGAEILIDASKNMIPVSLGSYYMAGITGPLHVVGGIIQRAATVLTGLLLTQAVKPGSIYDFTCHSGLSDLKTGAVITMSPEVMQIVLGSIQLGRYYGLNTYSLACTDAKMPDAQAAGECFFAMSGSFMAGATFISNAIACMAGMELYDHAQSVIDNEIAGFVKVFAKGPCMQQLEEALGSIADVVSNSDYENLKFLGHPFTVRMCRKNVYSPKIFEQKMLSTWLDGDRTSVLEKARSRAKEIIIGKRRLCVDNQLKKELFKLIESI